MRLAGDNRFLVATWIATRALIVFLIWWVSKGDLDRLQDIRFYLESAQHLTREHSMPDTELWQYPPGAAPVLMLPLLAGASHYVWAFVAFMLVVDATITWLLTRASVALGSRLGLWAWVLVMPLQREYPLLRFDLVPTLFAVAALLFVARRPLLLGALAGLGALVKAWPIVALAAIWQPRRFLLATAASIVVVLGGVALAHAVFGDQGRVVDNQASRGLQVEAVAATPWHVAALLEGEEAAVVYRSAIELADPRADQVADKLHLVTLAAMALLAAWWLLRTWLLQRDPARRDWLASTAAGTDLVAVGVLLALVTSRVLSPQFMIWLLGVLAVALSHRHSRLRGPAVVLAVVFACTAGVLRETEIVVIRNVLLVVATTYALATLLLGLRRGDDIERPVVDLLDAQSTAPRDAQHVGDASALAR